MAENLLVDGDNVICTPGGARGSVVALDSQAADGAAHIADIDRPVVLAPGPARFLAVSRLVEGKGLEYTIRAMSKAVATLPDARLDGASAACDTSPMYARAAPAYGSRRPPASWLRA